LNLFRISDFVLRNCILFNLGVLCPVEYFHGRGVSVAPVTVFHGARPNLSDSLNPNSTENFKYLWLVFRGAAGPGQIFHFDLSGIKLGD
jgi:hypothetical protein